MRRLVTTEINQRLCRLLKPFANQPENIMTILRSNTGVIGRHVAIAYATSSPVERDDILKIFVPRGLGYGCVQEFVMQHGYQLFIEATRSGVFNDLAVR